MRVLVLFALLGSAMAAHKNPQRIVGGSPTTVDVYPYMANMQYLRWGVWWTQWCGGSILNERSVVTAAHCVIGDRPSEWTARLGGSMASSGGTVYQISKLVVHAGYSGSTLDNDIAMAIITTPIVFSSTVAPVSIAGPNYNLHDGTNVITAGWGALATNGGAPEQLQHVKINIINWQFCRDQYAELKNRPGFHLWPDVTQNMICAGIKHVGGKDACQGDSGGPLVHVNAGRSSDPLHILIGIVSWGFQCAHPDYPGVNVRVNRYVDWIRMVGSIIENA